MDIKNKLQDYNYHVIELRRHFHMYPELSYEEFETTEFIEKELNSMGIKTERFEGTGLVGWIHGVNPGKCVGLRADMDALNVVEENDVPYKSKNEGKMHACGHDAHMAMLLGAAKILSGMKDEINGTVCLIFQPAEEMASGAKKIISQGNWYEKVDNFFGMHVWSLMESGKVSVEKGPRMAAGDIFEVKVTGKSGHGSMPNQGVDAVLIASHIVINLQDLVSRETSPLDPLVISVGTIKGGTRFNIIANDVMLDGTTRYFSKEIGKALPKNMERIIKGTAEMYRATAELKYTYVSPPVINDPESSEIAKIAATKILGKDAIVTEPMTTGGEDFSYYIDNKPGCFAFLGSKNKAKGTDNPHHAGNFNVDEDVLISGSGIYVQYALEYLNR